jgi:hypothetical protein
MLLTTKFAKLLAADSIVDNFWPDSYQTKHKVHGLWWVLPLNSSFSLKVPVLSQSQVSPHQVTLTLLSVVVQESLWKKAAAGQICRCVALQKQQHEFLASQLCKRQQKVAKVLANLVNGFWHSVEVLLIKQKVGISNLVKTQTQASNSSSKDFDGAVPMDVDFPGMEVIILGLHRWQKCSVRSLWNAPVFFTIHLSVQLS